MGDGVTGRGGDEVKSRLGEDVINDR